MFRPSALLQPRNGSLFFASSTLCRPYRSSISDRFVAIAPVSLHRTRSFPTGLQRPRFAFGRSFFLFFSPYLSSRFVASRLRIVKAASTLEEKRAQNQSQLGRNPVKLGTTRLLPSWMAAGRSISAVVFVLERRENRPTDTHATTKQKKNGFRPERLTCTARCLNCVVGKPQPRSNH